MADYIDRNLLAECVDSHNNVHWEDIANTPSADVQPVVHGEWIPEIEQMETEYPDSTEVYLETFQTGWKCSKCGDYSTIDSNFCPNCGADMRSNAK